MAVGDMMESFVLIPTFISHLGTVKVDTLSTVAS